MGYLINDSFIIRRQFIIPEADVQVMDGGSAYTLIATNNNFFAIPVFCYLKAAANQTTPYSGFVHIHLSNRASYTVGNICATYSENAFSLSEIGNLDYFSMLVNFQSSPNRYGGINGFKDLQIFWDTVPPVGDGDLIVNLGYIIQPL
jgi:hypothetical protein